MFDVLIVGGGPAALTAAIYSRRAGKSVLVVERMVPGGQIALTNTVENYPGIKKTDGMTLATMMFEHAQSLGTQFVFSDVLEFSLEGKVKQIRTHEGTFEGKVIILCLGASAKQLNLENEKKFLGRGVSYCATCDGNFFKDKVVAIVGGGNTSLEDSIYLSNLAKKVYLIHRRDEFKGDRILVEQLQAETSKPNSKIEVLYNSHVTKISGTDKLESITIENCVTKQSEELALDGLFIAIGRKPDTELLEGVELDKNGYIITNEKMETNIPGVYAAGDVRQKQLRQIITACSDGAIASVNTNEYISRNF